MDMMDMSTKSFFGNQVMSNKETFPAFGFGTSGRVSSTKLLFTKEQAAQNTGLAGPGPIYDVPGALGSQISSKHTTFPAYKMGARTLLDAHVAKEARPGPGTYPVEGAIGKQTLSHKSNAQTWKFGTSNRWSSLLSGDDKNTATPGYDNPRPAAGWLGDASAFSFGTSGRYTVGMGLPGVKPSFCLSPGPGTYVNAGSLGPQVYLTHAHERSMMGLHSPAPNLYNMRSTFGMQLSSKNKTASTVKFGTSERFSDFKSAREKQSGEMPNHTPGPGAYCV